MSYVALDVPDDRRDVECFEKYPLDLDKCPACRVSSELAFQNLNWNIVAARRSLDVLEGQPNLDLRPAFTVVTVNDAPIPNAADFPVPK